MTDRNKREARWLASNIVPEHRLLDERGYKVNDLLRNFNLLNGLIRSMKDAEIIQAYLACLAKDYQSWNTLIDSFFNPYPGWNPSTFTTPLTEQMEKNSQELKEKLQEIEAKYEEKYKGNLEDPEAPVFKIADERISSFYMGNN